MTGNKGWLLLPKGDLDEVSTAAAAIFISLALKCNYTSTTAVAVECYDEPILIGKSGKINILPPTVWLDIGQGSLKRREIASSQGLRPQVCTVHTRGQQQVSKCQFVFAHQSFDGTVTNLGLAHTKNSI